MEKYPTISRGGAVDIWSDEELISLHRVMQRHLRSLELVREDYIREKEGSQIIYLLDFEEIYAYLRPYAKEAKHSVVASYVLRHCKRPFVLPMGTLIELDRHLDRLSGQLWGLDTISRLSLIEGDVDSAIERLSHLVESESIDSPVTPHLMTDIKIVANSLARELIGHQSELERLRNLLWQDNIVGSSQFIDPSRITLEDQRITKEAWAHTLQVLNSQRPERSHSNFADATNVATAILLRRYTVQYPKGTENPYCAYLITDTPSLLNPAIWARNPLDEKYGLTTDVFRTPLEILYSTVVEMHFPEPDGRRDFAELAESICRDIRDRLPLCPASRIVGPLKRTEYGEYLERLESLKAYALSQSLDDFQKYVSDALLSPLRDFEDKWERSEQFDLNKAIGYDPDSSAAEIGRALLTSTNRVRTMIADIRKLLEQKLFEEGRGLSEPAITSEERQKTYSLSFFSLDESESKEDDLDCTQYRLYRRLDDRKDLVLAIDAYPGYYSCFWKTTRTLDDICAYLNDILEGMSLRPKRKARKREDVFQHGILAFTCEKRRELGLETPLDARELARELDKEGITYVRFNTPVADFCVDVLPQDVGGDTFVGVMSHLNQEDIIFKLFYATSRTHVWPGTLRQVLRERLDIYPIH